MSNSYRCIVEINIKAFFDNCMDSINQQNRLLLDSMRKIYRERFLEIVEERLNNIPIKGKLE